jgi:predicted Zn-dependent protease
MLLTTGRRLLVIAAAATLAACPRPKDGGTSPAGGGDGNAQLPPPIPAPIEVERRAPDAGHTPSARSPILDHMVAESSRWAEALKKQQIPGYYLSYRIQDERGIVIEAEGGGILIDTDDRDRNLDVEVRVGTPELDNRRRLRDPRAEAFTNLQRVGTAPFGSDEKAIRNALWLETDRRYREAITRLRLVMNDQQVAGSREDHPADFSREKAEVFVEPVAPLSVDKDQWTERVKACSARAHRGVATRATCRVDFEERTEYFVNSEGSQLQRSWIAARFVVSVGVKAPDGEGLTRIEQAFANSPEELPGDAEIDRMIAVVNKDLDALHDAPIVDPYVGPAILEGRAAAVFFHEVFGHRVEGHRQKDETSGQTFSAKIDKQIMPAWLTVYDDPTVTRLNGIPLNGFYRFDDEGVRAQRASLVESGVLKGFIQGRDPVKGFPRSNGHGRTEPGLPPVSRQGNLVVETERSVTKDELRQALLAEVKRQNKPYGMLFTDISGGFTNTSRLGSQSFEVTPVMAYRIYPDGREELVRGVDIVGTPLTALGSILSAARPMETFNGMCGAESGWVPVSATAPSLLLRSLEVERSFNPSDRGPVLDPPAVRGARR